MVICLYAFSSLLQTLKPTVAAASCNGNFWYLSGKFPIITLDEFIAIALDATRVVGIYPEIKNPVFINQQVSTTFSLIVIDLLNKYRGFVKTFSFFLYLLQVKWADGKKFEDKIVATLKKYGYKGSYMSQDWLKQPIFIQSFAATSLVHISNMTDSPKVFLIDDVTILTEDTNKVFLFTNTFFFFKNQSKLLIYTYVNADIR